MWDGRSMARLAGYGAALKALWLPPRSRHQELLDAEDIPAPDLCANLQDLRWLNRWLGSHWIVQAAVQRLWQQAGAPPQWRILDVGTGAGDIPVMLLRWGRRQGIQVDIVALDNHHGVLECRHAVKQDVPALTFVQADGLCLPFHAQSFDIVVCSTMLHHLEWQQGIGLLRGMASVARHGIVVNDLVRGRLHYYAACLFLPLVTRNRLTRHDGPLSVLRAYSVDEIRTMAHLAGLGQVRVRTILGYRVLLLSAALLATSIRGTGDGS